MVTQPGFKKPVTAPMQMDKDEVLYNGNRDEDDDEVCGQEDTEAKDAILKQKNLKR